MIFVDSNILIDVLDIGGAWNRWSARALAEASIAGPLAANAIVLAETAPRFATLAEQAAFLDDLGIDIEPLPHTAAFEAGRAFKRYREAGGPRTAILADFLIGGHAIVLGATLLTRDRKRFASYFPELNLITPETDHG